MSADDEQPVLFHISDILSVWYDKAYSIPTRPLMPNGTLPPERESHMEGMYELVAHMTGQVIITEGLPRALDACQKSLVQQFPWLGHCAPPSLDGLQGQEKADRVHDWIEGLETKYDAYHSVAPLTHYKRMSRADEVRTLGELSGRPPEWAESILDKVLHVPRGDKGSERS